MNEVVHILNDMKYIDDLKEENINNKRKEMIDQNLSSILKNRNDCYAPYE